MFKIYDGRNELWQWDLDRKLIISDPTITEVHFCNKTDNCSLVCEVYENDGLRLVDVPNILLQNAWDIRVYGYCGECYTKQFTKFKVNARTKPVDYVYTETEVKNWEALSERMDYIEEIVSEESISKAVDEYLQENPIEAGATPEQAEQIQQNTEALANKVDYDTFGQAINSVRTDSMNYTNVMCNGANKAVSFVNYSSMIANFNSMVLNDASSGPYRVGQNVMIVTLEVPDLWISGISAQHIKYNDTSDTDFVNKLKAYGSVQVGNYVFSALETQKVDLTDYDTSEEVDNKLANKTSFPTNKTGGWDFLMAYNPVAKTTTGYDVSTASEDGSSAPATNAVIRANKNRQLGTNTPTGDYHCTNKKYVDDKIGDIETALDGIISLQNYFLGGGNE